MQRRADDVSPHSAGETPSEMALGIRRVTLRATIGGDLRPSTPTVAAGRQFQHFVGAKSTFGLDVTTLALGPNNLSHLLCTFTEPFVANGLIDSSPLHRPVPPGVQFCTGRRLGQCSSFLRQTTV
jgi:hypothetical protein